MRITLNDGELSLIEWMAQERVRVAESEKKDGYTHGQQSHYERHLDGAGGEIAVAKYLGIYPDTETVYPPYPKFDILTSKGKRLDIKTTRYKSGDLQVTKNKKLGDCDYYVLVIVDHPVFDIVGYASSEDVIKPENLECRNKRGLYSYWVKQKDLKEL